MGIDAKEKTARSTSVGADERQSVQKDSDNSIPASEAKGNGEMENLEEMFLTVKTYVTIREILCYHLIRTFELQTYLSCPVVSILMLLHLFPKFFLTGKYFSPI